jgi:bifunctional non-homologous end joining protein LigD
MDSELKWDGYRIIASRGAGPIRLWSRSALDWSAAFPHIVAALKQLRVMSVILDGEAECLREDGTPDFNRLRSKERCEEARFGLQMTKPPRKGAASHSCERTRGRVSLRQS